MAPRQDLLNPYQPVDSVADADPDQVPLFSGPFLWAGRRIEIVAQQIPWSLWTVARIVVTVDEMQVERFIKWRWHKRAAWTFEHDGRRCAAMLQCSGANKIECRLFVNGFGVGDAVIPAKGFSLGLITVVVATLLITLVVRRTLGL